jgi:FkbM family methyltransferase
MGGLVQWCRPGTTDSIVLEDTFTRNYHRPNRPLAGNCVVLDLGANVGYTMADLAFSNPHARVIGVELDPANVRMAKRNTETFGSRCVVVEAAVWNVSGRIRYGGSEEWAFHVLDEKQTASQDRKFAAAITIDMLLKQQDVDRVRYVKMDIEGAEAAVLVPGARWLDRVDEIKIEVHPPATMESCQSVLEQAGFLCSKDTAHWSCLVGRRP